MELQIITPKQFRSVLVEWAEFTTPKGNMVVQPNHTPLVASIIPNSRFTFAHKDGTTESIMVHIGIVEVTKTAVRLLMHEE